METTSQEFLRLSDLAIEKANQALADLRARRVHPSVIEAAQRSLSTLQGLRRRVLDDTLPRPSLGRGLALSRGIGEWGDGTELFAVAVELEKFYLEKM